VQLYITAAPPHNLLKATDYNANTPNLRPRDRPLKIPRARLNPPKEKQAIFKQNEEFHISTSQNLFFFSTFYLKDLAKIFLLFAFRNVKSL